MINSNEFGLDPGAIAAETRSLARGCRTAVLLSRLLPNIYCGLDSFITAIDELCRQRLAAGKAQPEPELEPAL